MFTISIHAQIQTKNGKAKKAKTASNAFREKDTTQNNMHVYAAVGYYSSFRKLEQNTAFLTVPLGDRAFETASRTNGFLVGVKSQITPYMSFDFGAGFHSFGEEFSSIGDSVYRYSTRFRYFTLPLSIQFHTLKDQWKVYVQPGVQAHFFQGYKQVTVINEKETDAIENRILDDKNTLTLAAFVTGGVQYKFSKNYGIFAECRGIYQFTNMFNQQADFKLYPYSLGGAVGLNFYL